MSKFMSLFFTLILLVVFTSCKDEPSKPDDYDVVPDSDQVEGPGFVITPKSLETIEGGNSAVFTIKLAVKPEKDVNVVFTSLNTAEGTVSPPSVVFNETNWSGLKTITVNPVDDSGKDGDVNYKVTVVSSSGDLRYNGLTDEVEVTNKDNDSPGISVSKEAIETSEAGESDSFTIVLNSKPQSNVKISIASSDEDEGE